MDTLAARSKNGNLVFNDICKHEAENFSPAKSIQQAYISLSMTNAPELCVSLKRGVMSPMELLCQSFLLVVNELQIEMCEHRIEQLS